MNRMLVVLIFSVLLISTGVHVVSAETASADTKYLGIDNYWNALRMQINITTDQPGKFVYLENYYSIDSSGKSKFYSSERYFDGYLNATSLNIQTLRPKDRAGQSYTIIELVLILNGNRTVYSYDLRRLWAGKGI